MTWFMDPMPDGDQVRLIGTTLRTAHGNYSTSVTATQTALETTGTVWQSDVSSGHTVVATRTQGAAQAHLQWLLAMADVLDTISAILKIIGYLQMAWLAIQAGSIIYGFLTGGVGFVEGEAADLEVEGAIQTSRFSVEAILKATFKALMDHLVQVVGTLAGAGFGAYQGIQTVEQQHLSGWNAALTLFGDTTTGAFTGLTITTSPVTALAGADLGLAQVDVHQALGQNVSQQDAYSIITGDILGMAGLEGALNSFSGPDGGISVPAGGKALPSGDYSGPWVNDAIPGTVEAGGPFSQSLPGSCVSATGSALTNGALSEADLVSKLGEWSDITPLRTALNNDPNVGNFAGGYFINPQDAVTIAEAGPLAAKLQMPGSAGHMVLINAADDGNFIVSDPLPEGVGSTYKVTADWLKKYVAGGVWPTP